MKPAAVFACFLLAAAPAMAADASLSEAANTSFLTANAHKPGVTVLPSGLQYRVLRSGLGRRAGASDVARVFYSTRLIDGTVVDGTSPGLPVTLALNGVIAGLSEALKRMHEGDEWQLVIPPALALGSHATAGVPANQVLVFDLTLSAALPAASAPAPDSDNPFSINASNYHQGAMLTIHP